MNPDRIDAVATVLAELGYDGLTAFDRTEPEYSTLESLYERFSSPAHVKLVGILAGSQDYFLNGTAQEFWQQLDATAAEFDTLESKVAVHDLMGDFMEAPINKRKRDQKRHRLVKLLQAGFGEWFVENHDTVEPIEVWRQLAEGLDSAMDSQTVVLAMKIYDIAHLAHHNEYLEFPLEIPIPSNLHVDRVAHSSGIVDDGNEEEVIEAWTRVIETMSEQLDEPLSLFRIDSIVFQAGQIIGKHEPDRDAARDSVIEYFESVLLEAGRFNRLATELTATM